MRKSYMHALIVMFLQLEQLEKAGVPIMESLAMVRDGTSEKSLRKTLGGIIHELNSGQGLHQAMELYPRAFDPMIIGLIRLGEESGTMTQVFSQCLKYLRRRDDHARIMRRVTLKPKISFAVLVVLVSLTRETAAPLFIVASVIAVYYLILGLCRISPSFHYLVDRILLFIPRLGRLLAQDSWARFAETLAMMFDSGVDLNKSLGLAAEAIPNDVIRRSAERAIPLIISGLSLHEAFRQSGHMDHLALAMIKAGEDSGNLSKTLNELSEYYDKESADALTAVQQLANPILMSILGAMYYLV